MKEMNTIITIGRQFGSGGKEIAEKLGESLQIPVYDKEMLAVAAKDSGICQELFESHDEKPTNSFLYSLVMDTYSMGYSPNAYMDMPINHKVFLAQFDAIKKLANEGPCILVGRCADYALDSYDNCLSVFIHANLDARIRRIARMYDLTEAKAKDMIVKTDKKRATYYNYYTNKKWGSAKDYNLCIDSGKFGLENAAKIIIDAVQIFDASKKK